MREMVGTPRDFAAEGFAAKDHLELAEGLGALDMARGAKIAGARFYFLTGVGARLELGLLNAGMACAIEHGFVPMITPPSCSRRSCAGPGSSTGTRTRSTGSRPTTSI